MPLSDFDPLLGILAEAFGTPVGWAGGTFPGRFNIEPFTVTLPMTDSGIGETQTWLYCERAVIPGPGVPDIGTVLTIRGRRWEIVEAGEDDLGELAFRLIKYEGEEPAPIAAEDTRRPGRPSRREDIERVYARLERALSPGATAGQVFAAVRREITGDPAETPGLSDKTLRKIIGPLLTTARRDLP